MLTPTERVENDKASALFYTANALDVVNGLLDKPDLIFLDPPFNNDQQYVGHYDNQDWMDYYRDMTELLASCYEQIRDGGSLWLNLPDELVSWFDSEAQCVGFTRVNWCIWHFRFGQHTHGRFVRSKSHALWFSKGRHHFYPDAVRVPSVRQQIGDDRAVDGGRTPMDVWGFEKYWGRVQGNNAERVPDAPNQLPEVYLERVLRACTEEGDLVCDPFSGSGTTATVALALGRNSVVGDISPTMIQNGIERAKEGAVRV